MSKRRPHWGTKRAPSGVLVGTIHHWTRSGEHWASTCGLLTADSTAIPPEVVRYNPEVYGCQLCARKVDR